MALRTQHETHSRAAAGSAGLAGARSFLRRVSQWDLGLSKREKALTLGYHASAARPRKPTSKTAGMDHGLPVLRAPWL